jgi:hypothetical protein
MLYMTHMQRAQLKLEIYYETIFLNIMICIRIYNKQMTNILNENFRCVFIKYQILFQGNTGSYTRNPN